MSSTGKKSGREADASASQESSFTKDSFIPLFDGQPSSYQEWRKRISIYHLKMKMQKRQAEAVLNIIGSLQGTAWKLVENFDLSKVDKDDSFDNILKILDSAFKYDNRVMLPQDFDGYFSHLSRKPGETLLSFVTEHDEKLRKIEEHGIKIPSEIQGWLLLKKANVTREQRQLVVAQAPKLEKLRVQEALYLILGQDHKAATSLDRDRRQGLGRFHRRGNYVAIDEEDIYDPIDDYENVFYEEEDADDYAQPFDDGWTDEPHFDAQAAYYESSEHEADEHDGFDVDTYDEAYAAYLDARRRFQDLKLSRGFLPVVALADQGGSSSPASPSSPSKGKGHGTSGKGYGGSGTKGRGKGRKGKATFKAPRPGGKAPDPRGRAAAAMQCLRCGATGHQAANCPRPPKHAATSPAGGVAKKANVEGVAAAIEPHDHGLVIFEDVQGRPRVDCTMLDPGASAFLLGSGPFQRYVGHL